MPTPLHLLFDCLRTARPAVNLRTTGDHLHLRHTNLNTTPTTTFPRHDKHHTSHQYPHLSQHQASRRSGAKPSHSWIPTKTDFTKHAATKLRFPHCEEYYCLQDRQTHIISSIPLTSRAFFLSFARRKGQGHNRTATEIIRKRKEEEYSKKGKMKSRGSMDGTSIAWSQICMHAFCLFFVFHRLSLLYLLLAPLKRSYWR
jgi:hypothetical protein